MTKGVNRVGAYLRLMRFDRPIGTLLLLWPVLWALWLATAGIFPPTHVLCVFVSGVVLMRAAGCVINDIADRHIDGGVKRTQSRPLVTGAITLNAAIVLFVLLCLLALALVLTLNRLTILLSLLALLSAMLYPLAKRYIALPQLVLAVAFSWGIPMAFAALTHHVPWVAWLLFGASFCWIMAYDTEYAMLDREDDLKIGVNSSAIYFGRFDRLWIGIFHIMMLFILATVGFLLGLTDCFFIMLVVAACFCVYQQYLLIDRQAAGCFRAFLNNNWVGAVIFFGIVCSFSRY